MDETIGFALNVDGNGALDQQIQPNEQHKKVNLSELPKELLEQILIHLNDRELLAASHVCQSFAAAAETAFAQKYSNHSYKIWDDVQKSFHKVMLTKYGGMIRELDYMGYQDDELLTLIEQKCCSLRSATFFGISKMPMLKGLKKIILQRVKNLNDTTFSALINFNHQLESLHIDGIKNCLLNILDGRLNMLKDVTLDTVHVVTDLQKIRLKSLETLDINMMDTDNCIDLLQAMNCNPIKALNVKCFRGSTDNNGFINEICSFKMLVSLRLHNCGFLITDSQLRRLSVHLPQLTEFGMAIDEGPSNLENRILAVLSILPKLTKLTIKLKKASDFTQFLNDLDTSIYDFHGCFAGINTKIEIIAINGSKISTSKDRICVCNVGLDSIKLYWMDNLGETSVRKVINGLCKWVYEFKFVNNCADQTFDISTFMHPNLEHTRCLEVKSNGPITVNANATRYPGFFPFLKILKIHLANHSAIDFFEKCDKKFCAHIEELWLNTKSIPENHAGEQGSDLVSALAKFENVKTLHMNPSPALDSEHLFSVCQKLKELRIRREW